MITISSNIHQVIDITVQGVNDLAKTDRLARTCATSVLDLMKKRVFRDGIASDGAQIGVYSPAYMKIRNGNFSNAVPFKKGKNKGGIKNAGVFTGGAKKGTQRPNYNRGPDTKVIASLTRQMENDMKLITTEAGYGIGFTNSHNYDKSQWVEAKYRPIFSISAAEEEAINKIIADAVSS